MFSRPKTGNAKVQGSSRLKQILFVFSCFLALFCYYLLLDFKSTNAKAMSGELTLGSSDALQQTPQGSGLIAFLFDYTGSFVYVLPLFIVYLGGALFLQRISLKEIDLFKLGLKILGFNTFVLGTTALFSVLWRNDSMGEGGILGDFLNIILGALLSDSLAAVAALLLSLTGLLLIIGRNPLQLCESLGDLVMRGINRGKDKAEDPGKSSAAAPEEPQGQGGIIVQDFEPRFASGTGTISIQESGAGAEVHEAAQPAGMVFGQSGAGASAAVSGVSAASASDSGAAVSGTPGMSAAAAAQKFGVHADTGRQGMQGQPAAAQPTFGASNKSASPLYKAEPSFGDDDSIPDFSGAAGGIGPAGTAGAFTKAAASAAPAAGFHDAQQRVEPGFGNIYQPHYQNEPAPAAQPQSFAQQGGASSFNQSAADLRPATYIQQSRTISGHEIPEGSMFDRPNAMAPEEGEDNSVSTIITRSPAVVMPKSGYSNAVSTVQEQDGQGGVSTIVTVQTQEPVVQPVDPVEDPNEVHTVITHHVPEPAAPDPVFDANEVHTNIFTSPAPAPVNAMAAAAPSQYAAQNPAQALMQRPQSEAAVSDPSTVVQTTAPAVPNAPFAPTAAVPPAEPMQEYADLSPSADSYGPSQLKPQNKGNIINFADFAEDEDRPSFEVNSLPEGMQKQPAAEEKAPLSDALRDDKEHINEKDLALRYPSASRGVLSADAEAATGAAEGEVPAVQTTEQSAAPAAEVNAEQNTAAEFTESAAPYAEQKDDFNAPAEAGSAADTSAEQSVAAAPEMSDDAYAPEPVPTAEPEAQIQQPQPQLYQPQTQPAHMQPQMQQSQQIQPGMNSGLSFSPVSAAPAPAAQAVQAAVSAQSPYREYNRGQNSNTSNLPSYMQSTANGLNVEAPNAPLVSKPLDFNFIPSSVSAPKTFYDNWRPGIDLLTPSPVTTEIDRTLLVEQANQIDRVLRDFNIKAHVVSYENGPVITRYALELEPGVRFASINNLVQDLERNLKVQSNTVRAISSLPGTMYAGLEVPSPQRRLISLREVVDTETFATTTAELPLCLGEDVVGNPVVVDLATAPHLLIAGTTGSGKSAGLNAMLISLLLKRSPAELRLIMIDPKRLEFSLYNDLPHLITPVISDVAEKTSAALQWCVDEMERRYKLIEAFSVRKLSEYNDIIERAQLNGELVADPAWKPEMGGNPPALKKLPYIVIVIEEFADLMAQTSGRGKKGEDTPEQALSRLAAKSRACGIHIILATQTPRADIITGGIRANMPSRIAYTVQNHTESNLVLNESGAECLLGMGDMLGKFNGYNRNGSFRAHGAFVSNSDVARVVEHWKLHGRPEYVDKVTERPEENVDVDDGSEEEVSGIDKLDALFDKAADYARDYYARKQKAVPISELQVMFSIGYARAKKLWVQLQREGVING